MAQAAAVAPLLLEPSVNGAQHEVVTARFLGPAGPLYVNAVDLKQWGVTADNLTLRSFSGARWLCLEDTGARYEIDLAALTLSVDFPLDKLKGTQQSLIEDDRLPVTYSRGGFFNYDLRGDRVAGAVSRGLSWDFGAFGSPGLFTSSFFSGDAGRGTTRLDTTFRHDNPVKITSALAGDYITRPGNYGPSVRMGGLQYARNFANDPQLVTFPSVEVGGVAVVPSTVDIFVNNARTFSTQVNPGPFSVSNLPVPVGAGNVRLVVRDVFGRETTTVVPFVRYDTLLRAGLSDFSFDAGWLRRSYATVSNDYGAFATTGMYRYGVNNGLTLEGRAEGMSDRGSLGGAVLFTVPVLGLATVAASASRAETQGAGYLGKIGFQRRERDYSFAAGAEQRSANYTDIAFEPGQVRTLALRQFSASTRVGANQWLNALALRQTDTSGRFDTDSIGWSVALPRSITLSANLSRFSGSSPGSTVVSLSVAMPLGDREYAVAAYEKKNNSSTADATLQVSRNLLETNSFGYRLLAGEQSGKKRLEAGAAWQTGVGTFGVEAAESFGQQAFRAGARGGLVVAGGEWELSRYIDSSFAIVKTADFPDVRIFANNQEVGRTNSSGIAVVPRLTGFLTNRLAFEPEDIPLEGVFRENVQSVKIATGMGVLVDLGVKRQLSATVALFGANGRPVPAGATVRLEGGSEEFPVAGGGRVFISGLERGKANPLVVQIGEAQCRVSIELPGGFASGTSLGPFTCK